MPGNAKKKCPKTAGNLVVQVRRQNTKKPTKWDKLSGKCALELTPDVDNPKDSISNRTTFKNLCPGSYNLKLKPGGEEATLPYTETTNQNGEVIQAETKVGVGAQGRNVQIEASKTRMHVYRFYPRLLRLVSADQLFAPGAEQLEIVYDIQSLGDQAVWLEIASDKLTGDKLAYRCQLSDEEKKDGRGKKLRWDGKANQGTLTGKWVSPAYSPYRITLKVEKKAPLHLDLKDEKKTKVEVEKIEIAVDAPDDKIVLNDPDGRVLVKSKVWIKKKAGGSTVTPIEIDVAHTFTENGGNTAAANSFNYSGAKRLGKKGNPAAIHWEGHADSVSNSTDSYKTKCTARTVTAAGVDQGIAKIWFKPSGVGRDKYKLKGETFAANGTTRLATTESNELTIWRKIHFANIYTMNGENYIDAATVHAQIAPALETNAYVLYARGAINTLGAGLTAKYIGLYKTGGGMKSWPADFSPQKLETSAFQLRPTATELADYGGVDPVKKAAAKTAIEAKAQAWFNAIVDDYVQCVTDWFAAAAVPGGGNTLLAVQYYHPKLSNQGDGATNFWPAGIRVNLANPGSGLNTPGDPDQATWREVQGFNRGNIVVVFKNYGTAARLQIICRHEIGHATKSEFKRQEFGVGDHGASGLMTPYGASNTFSNRDIKILRGVLP